MNEQFESGYIDLVVENARHYEIAVGLLFFAAAFATVLMAFKGSEYADYKWPAIWWMPLCGGLALAAWLVAHALDHLVN